MIGKSEGQRMTEHKRTVRPPHGYRATFVFRSQDTSLEVPWDPDVPSSSRFRSNRAQRKLIGAYESARDDFLRDVATMLSGEVLVVDEGSRLTTIEPGTVQ